MSGPSTPAVAAFFDIDGTLLVPPSLERQLLRYLVWREEVSARHWLRTAACFASRVWHDPLAATHGNKAHYAGVRVAALHSFCSLFRRYPLGIRPLPLARLQWHAEQGHRIVLVSGTLQPLAESVAQILTRLLPPLTHPICIVATQLEIQSGVFTGRTLGPAVCGPAKAATMQRLAAERGIDLTRSFAYGDCALDRWMLEAVGHPFAVHPSKRLRWLAVRRGWSILTEIASQDSSPYPTRAQQHVAF